MAGYRRGGEVVVRQPVRCVARLSHDPGDLLRDGAELRLHGDGLDGDGDLAETAHARAPTEHVYPDVGAPHSVDHRLALRPGGTQVRRAHNLFRAHRGEQPVRKLPLDTGKQAGMGTVENVPTWLAAAFCLSL